MDRVLFEIIIITFFIMWCIWDKKNVIEDMKRWIEKYIYNTNEILFNKIWYPIIVALLKHSFSSFALDEI